MLSLKLLKIQSLKEEITGLEMTLASKKEEFVVEKDRILKSLVSLKNTDFVRLCECFNVRTWLKFSLMKRIWKIISLNGDSTYLASCCYD